MSTVAASINLQMSVVETITANVPAATSPQVTHNGFNLNNLSLNASSTPAATVVSAQTYTLSGGAATIDLTNLLGVNGGAVSGNGLQLRGILWSTGANANNISIATGASNGYAVFGASGKVTAPPNSTGAIYFNNGSGVVGSGAKNIDLAGTGSQQINIVFLFG